MDRSTTRRTVPALILAVGLIAVVAVMATGVFGRTPSPVPSDPPASEAPATPAPTQVPPPSLVPTEPPANGDFEVDLEVPTPHDVDAVVDDQTGRIVHVVSGTPGDGMSVRWFDAIVENTSDDTIEVTFVGLPQDDVVQVVVSEADGEITIAIDQAAPPLNSDALGNDRVLVIEFDTPVSAKYVTVTVSN